MRILIADDQEIVREGVRVIIEREPGWEVCGVAENGRAPRAQGRCSASPASPIAQLFQFFLPGLR